MAKFKLLLGLALTASLLGSGWLAAEERHRRHSDAHPAWHTGKGYAGHHRGRLYGREYGHKRFDHPRYHPRYYGKRHHRKWGPHYAPRYQHPRQRHHRRSHYGGLWGRIIVDF